MDSLELKELKKFATEIRIETLKEIKNLGFGHLGGALSIIENLAVLYGKVMKIDPRNPEWEERDWLVMSKGHAGPALYAALAIKGFFPREELMTLNQPGTNLPSHCDKNLTTGVDMTTGSLGQGVSSAIGIALGNKIEGKDNYTYLITGDGELDEGQVWEGTLFAAHNKLDNLITFIDENKKQLDGYTKDINNLGKISEKFADFGWDTYDVDGADMEAIYKAINKAKQVKNRPSVIILDTVKGQGVPFIEKTDANHHMRLSEEQKKLTEESIKKLEEKLKLY